MNNGDSAKERRNIFCVLAQHERMLAMNAKYHERRRQEQECAMNGTITGHDSADAQHAIITITYDARWSISVRRS